MAGTDVRDLPGRSAGGGTAGNAAVGGGTGSDCGQIFASGISSVLGILDPCDGNVVDSLEKNLENCKKFIVILEKMGYNKLDYPF